MASCSSSVSGQSALFSIHPPRSPCQPLKTVVVSFPLKQNPTSSAIVAQLRRRPPSIGVRLAAADPKTISGIEEDQVLVNKPESEEDQEDFPPMKVLIQAYKKALVDGDEKSMYEVEAKICIIENEKNNLTLKSEELTAEIVSGRQKLLRLQADFENFRKRTEKDRLTFTSDLQGELIESLLPLVDSFEKAKQHLKPETEKEKKIDGSYQGIYKQFVEVMRSLRVAVVGTVGKPFDPAIHEAVGREESQKFKEGIVTQEVRRGFVLGGRLLRPATVKVSVGPGPGKAPLANGKSSAAEFAEDTSAMSSSS